MLCYKTFAWASCLHNWVQPIVLSYSAMLSWSQLNLSHAEYRCNASFHHYCLVSYKEKWEIPGFGWNHQLSAKYFCFKNVFHQIYSKFSHSWRNNQIWDSLTELKKKKKDSYFREKRHFFHEKIRNSWKMWVFLMSKEVMSRHLSKKSQINLFYQF